jgi:hypothetical protein
MRQDQWGQPTGWLAEHLRADGENLLPELVAGPVVFADIDMGTTTTLCGDSAVLAARAWGAKLADPSRPGAVCVEGAHRGQLACAQLGASYLSLGFDPDADDDHLDIHVAMVVEGAAANRDRFQARVDEVRRRLSAAPCP